MKARCAFPLAILALSCWYAYFNFLRPFYQSRYRWNIPCDGGSVKTELKKTTNEKDPLLVLQGRDEDTPIKYQQVHRAQYPAISAGRWVNRPEQAMRLYMTPEHLQCLDLEMQGNCHNTTANLLSDEKPKKSRLASKVVNSPGILNANDSWVWESDHPEYKVLSPYDPQWIRTLVKDRTFFLVGDSLTRQWRHSMRCEFIHILGFSPDYVNKHIKYHQEPGLIREKNLNTVVETATPRDYLIFNFGHHLDPSKLGEIGETWKEKYTEAMKNAMKTKFGNIPSSHIFFRTTSVRHFARGAGDWYNRTTYTAGAVEPNMTATWDLYGGYHPAQPIQNLISLDMIRNRSVDFGVLDTAPMMLARADATFDGAHFCLPGPMEFWSRMLYYRIHWLKVMCRIACAPHDK